MLPVLMVGKSLLALVIWYIENWQGILFLFHAAKLLYSSKKSGIKKVLISTFIAMVE